METTVDFETKSEYEAAYPLLSGKTATARCLKAAEFVDTLFQIANLDQHVFRGQSRSCWPIIATLFRKDFIAKPAIDRLNAHADDEIARGRFFDGYLQWEQAIVTSFAENCLNEGIPLPYIPYNETLKFDTEVVSAYFLARNYGLPNRLLDFTTSPTVAAWFAADVERDSDSAMVPDDIVVWAIREDFLSQFGYEIVSTSWANAQIPQMQRQKAVLLVDTSGRENFVTTGKFQPMEYMIEDFFRSYERIDPLDMPIWRVTLPQEEALELQGILGNYDLSHIYLFPTIENVVRRTLGQFGRFLTVQSIQDSTSRD
ncbi:MAG: FRG domain-containing protein [Chloroflexi bacterium]|nr:FRG domain-containing protein [Chloroflexota bacterium]